MIAVVHTLKELPIWLKTFHLVDLLFTSILIGMLLRLWMIRIGQPVKDRPFPPLASFAWMAIVFAGGYGDVISINQKLSFTPVLALRLAANIFGVLAMGLQQVKPNFTFFDPE